MIALITFRGYSSDEDGAREKALFALNIWFEKHSDTRVIGAQWNTSRLSDSYRTHLTEIELMFIQA